MSLEMLLNSIVKVVFIYFQNTLKTFLSQLQQPEGRSRRLAVCLFDVQTDWETTFLQNKCTVFSILKNQKLSRCHIIY